MAVNDRLAAAIFRYHTIRLRRYIGHQQRAAPAARVDPSEGHSDAGGWLMGARVAAVAVGATLLTGVGAANAQAVEAPSKAGWDGARFWFQDETGGWRWTSHRWKYEARTRGEEASEVRREPVFRGRAGWDPVDRVYWYKDGTGWWRWTGHWSKYERYAGASHKAERLSTEARPSRQSAEEGSSKDRNASVGSGGRIEKAIGFASAQVGEPYVWGGEGPNGWDCSGLVQEAYRRAGISLPRVAADQYRAVQPITRGQLRRGDLVFWSTNGASSGVHHVAVYLGNAQYLEAPRPGRSVRVSSFSSYTPNMFGRPR
ncbi:C40 family peptidase [Streptomyces chartreusis]|uniref:C40 family peptidase n=1 Tax=Streptomyces chartreusis TaxID=1969 RepID=UPI00386E5431